jgi:hypothetical protein
MKITREILKDLIMEQLGDNSTQQPEAADNEKDIASKSALAEKFKKVALIIPKMKLDSAEVSLLDSILSELLEFANDQSGKAKLSILKDKIPQILGTK